MDPWLGNWNPPGGSYFGPPLPNTGIDKIGKLLADLMTLFTIKQTVDILIDEGVAGPAKRRAKKLGIDYESPPFGVKDHIWIPLVKDAAKKILVACDGDLILKYGSRFFRVWDLSEWHQKPKEMADALEKMIRKFFGDGGPPTLSPG
jgi:hypothetical protein